MLKKRSLVIPTGLFALKVFFVPLPYQKIFLWQQNYNRKLKWQAIAVMQR